MAPFAEVPISPTPRVSRSEVGKEPDLVDGWWTSDDVFSLERRAILSKTWMCIAHSSQFTKPGDYISFELANYPILIIRGKDHVIRAFHNVCRHRAYTITKKPQGSSLVLSCRYHGWSYDTRGKLVKAPQFEGIEGFEKGDNSLFKIHTCTDHAGFIHINLDAGSGHHAPGYKGTGSFAAKHCISADSKWMTGWEISQGAFNWKTVRASDSTNISTHVACVARASLWESFPCIFRRSDLDIRKYSTLYIAPTMNITAFQGSHIWAMMTILPVSATQCTLKFDVFTSDLSMTTLTKTDTNALIRYGDVLPRTLEQQYEDIQSSGDQGNASQLALLKEHLRLERRAGGNIYPAKRQDAKSESFCRAEELCNELETKAKFARADSANGSLEW